MSARVKWHMHHWTEWGEVLVFNGNVYYQLRTCTRCGKAQRRSL